MRGFGSGQVFTVLRFRVEGLGFRASPGWTLETLARRKAKNHGAGLVWVRNLEFSP